MPFVYTCVPLWLPFGPIAVPYRCILDLCAFDYICTSLGIDSLSSDTSSPLLNSYSSRRGSSLDCELAGCVISLSVSLLILTLVPTCICRGIRPGADLHVLSRALAWQRDFFSLRLLGADFSFAFRRIHLGADLHA